MELLLDGALQKPGSIKDVLVRHALRMRRRAEYLKILAIVQSSANTQAVGKTLNSLLSILVPEAGDEVALRARKAQALLEKETKKPLRFIPLGGGNGRQRHVRARRGVRTPGPR